MISNTANSTLTTNFNVTPYYDDYTMNKEYYRILFKPGYAVQSRELTQIQSMIQSQIKRFGVNIFKEGSLVVPGQFTFRVNVDDKKGSPLDYIKIKANDVANNTVNVATFLGKTITGQTNRIRAHVTHVLDTDGTTANTKTLFVTYLGAAPANNEIRKFVAGETLLNRQIGTCIVNDANTNPIGYGSSFRIDEGVLFAKDHFIYFPTQEVILDRYNPLPTCKVGFFLTEEIVDSTQDASLLDPALETSNYAAPGADRLKISAKLSVVDINFIEPNDFITLFTMNNGVLQISNDKTQYNILGDTMASRTYDESGDYVIRGYNVQISEHDKVTYPIPNNGRYENGNNQNLVVSVDAGHGYVKGYSVTNYDKTDIAIPKARTFQNVYDAILSTTMGSYVTVNELVGCWNMTTSGTIVDLYDTPNKRISNDGYSDTIKWSTGSPVGTKIGYATFIGIEYIEGVPGYDATFNIYLTDVRMNAGKSFSQVRSLYTNNSGIADAGADILIEQTPGAVLQEIKNSPLLFYIGSKAVKSVRNPDGTPCVNYIYNKTATNLTIGETGNVNFNLVGPTNETLPYGTTTLSDTDKRQDLILTCNEAVNIGPLWSATVSAQGTVVSGAGTYFTRLNVGDKLIFSGVANTYYISNIISDSILQLSTPVPDTDGNSWITGNTITKAYRVGDTINLTGFGLDAGADRTVEATPTSLSIDLKETFPNPISASLNYKIYTANSPEAVKTLKTHRLVKISCAASGIKGPFYLGFSDVYGIRKVVKKTGSAPTSMDDGTDVTKYFTLDNGQKDTHYDIGFIKKSGSLALAATDYLMVELDYFEPNYTGRAGFFSVNSYPIQDDDTLFNPDVNIRTENIPVYISNGSDICDLKNYIDFRPVKTRTAVDTTLPSSASIDPASTSYSFYGMKMPFPNSGLTYNYSYYLGRSDIVVVTKDNVLTVVNGIPSDDPVPPVALENQMVIAILDIAPYPSLSPFFGNALRRKDLTCKVTKTLIRGWTMKDIGGLDRRIQNLEYYTSLTMLEKDAVNLKVLDENGQERFKNGIFVDTFKDTSLSSKGTNPDFRIAIDPVELSIRPLFGTDSIGYIPYSVDNAVVLDNLVMLPYEETEFFTQNKVTDFRNLERGTYLFQGQMELTPQQDVWIDTTQLPDETLALSVTDATMAVGTSVGSKLSLTGANGEVSISGSGLLLNGTNNESYFANTVLTIITPNISSPLVTTTTGKRYRVHKLGKIYYILSPLYHVVSLSDPKIALDPAKNIYYYYPNGVPRAPVDFNMVGNYVRGVSSNTIKKIIDATTDLNGVYTSLIVEPSTSFMTNENLDIWSSLDFGYPTANIAQSRANGYTGISTQITSTAPMYKHKVNVNDIVRGVTSGANARITGVTFDKQNLIKVTTTGLNSTANTTGFSNGETVNFYWNSNAAYMGVSSSVYSDGANYVKSVDVGDIVKGVTSGAEGTVINTEYNGSTLVAVSADNTIQYQVGEGVNFFYANNTYKSISATVSSISASEPPDPAVDTKITKNLINTVWEGWKSTVTGYALYKGSGTSKTKVGIYSSLDEARAVASNWTTKQGGGVATIETLYNNTRVGKNWFATTSSDSAVGSNKLISSEVIPYIRPQVITVYATGLKPFSKMFVWFDGVNVTNYCTPLTPKQYKQSVSRIPVTPDAANYKETVATDSGTTTVNVDVTYIVPDPATGMANSSCPLIVRNSSDLFFRFQIGAGEGDPKFRTGSRNLVIMDNSQANPINMTDETDATTIASAFFFADGTKQTTQRTVYSTKGYLKTSEDISEQYTSQTDMVLPNTWTKKKRNWLWWFNNCFAYTISINVPEEEEGIFCTGFDVFVASKSQTRKLWFEVLEMDNAGQVSSSRIPGSVVYVENQDILISENGTDNPTQVRFNAPIFLMNKKQYAFVIHSFSPPNSTVDPDTYLWISRMGEIDKNTGARVSDRTRMGTFFQSTNGRQWEPIQDIDLVINVYRAEFTPGTATVILGNRPVEKLFLTNESSSFKNLVGDHFSAGDVITYSGSNGTFSVGNVVKGKQSGTVGTVLSIPSTTKIRVSNTNFVKGETIDAYNGNTYLKISATVSDVANSTAVLTYCDETAANVYFEMTDSTGGFVVGDRIVDISSGAQFSANIASIENYSYCATSFEPKVLDFLKTDFKYDMATVSNNSSTLSGWTMINESETQYWPDEKVIYSRSDELNTLGGVPSNQVRVTMNSISKYVTPVLDLDATHTIYIDNIINNDTSGEDGKSGGNAINKYISQTVTLADGQDAEDVKVYLTAYRPPGTDVKVYIKVKNAYDPEPIESKNWIELIKDTGGDSLYSSVANRLDFREFLFKFSNDYMTGDQGQFEYTTEDGTTYSNYKYFTVKIVLTATNSAVVPRVADLRVLALQI